MRGVSREVSGRASDMTYEEQKEWAIGRCHKMFKELERRGRTGVIPVWRVITAPVNWVPGNQPLGSYWSWDENAAEAHWGDSSNGNVEWIMHGEIAMGDVDWVSTISQNANPDYEHEKEIRLKAGKKVFLKWYRRADGSKTQTDVNQVMETLLEAPLDRSHAARLQRAREQGFNVDEPHYHGTPGGDFDEFDPDRTADEDLAYGKGVYSTRDPDAASGYSRPGSSWGNDTDDARPTVYKVYVRVKNPFDLDAVYPYAEVKRIFEHCFDEDTREGIELWTDIVEEAQFSSGHEELNELEERLMELEGASSHEDIDPDDYEEGRKDPEYIEDVEHALTVEEKSLKRQIEFVTRRVEQEFSDHQAALASGRIGGAYGRDIYKALWKNTDGYHDWRAESQLFGGESETFEFKTEANEWLEELGYDGITHTDNYNPGNKGKAHKVTIAFRPEQVRSAHAMFDPEKINSRKMHESVEEGWFYHSTDVDEAVIRRDGLRSSEWEDEEIDEVIGHDGIHHLLFYTDRPQHEYGENCFRFRRPAVADAYSPDRGAFFYSREPFVIPPASIQVLRDEKWVPLVHLTESAGTDVYPPDEKFHGPVSEIRYLPVSVIHRREMDFRPEVLTVSDKVAANMDFSEPVEVTAFRFGPNNDEDEPAVTVTDGHHRTAAAIQTGRPYLPVSVRSVNARGRKLNALIALSRKIEGSL
jgi:hypothetical protein